MANPYPAEFMTQRTGRGLVVRLGGAINFTDPTNQPGGGGSGSSGMVVPVVAASSDASEVTSHPPSGAATVDGVVLATGDRVLLTVQSSTADNGVWEANTAGVWTRPTDWTGTLPDGITVPVGDPGSNNYLSIWQATVGTAFVVGTDDPQMNMMLSSAVAVFSPQTAAAPTVTLEPPVLSIDSQTLNIPNMPSSDPHVAGQVWSNMGVLTVSAG